MNKINNKGITLVSLVITIIIMLILAGVSLSMVTGDSSVLGQAKKTAFLQEIAGYKEELAISFLDDALHAQKKIDKSTITARDKDSLRNYIPSMKDEDLDDYMIIAGELYYVGNDEFELSVCKEQGYVTRPEGMSAEDFADGLEGTALETIIKNMAGKVITEYNSESDKEEVVGVPLAKKNANVGFGTANSGWTIITELKDGENVATYADGWYYVEAGKKIPTLGALKYSYIINYSTNKAVRFDSKKHVILSSGGNLSVSDGLVYNADPTNMDGSSKSWGSATLHGFDGTVKEGNKVISGWTDTEFITDGIDDAVSYKIPSDKNFNNGLTIEFYGKINKLSSNREAVVFAKKNVNEVDDKKLMLGLWTDTNTFWFGYSGHRHWATTNISNIISNDFYLTLTYSPDNVDKLYLNAEELSKSPVNGGGSITWNGVKEKLNDNSIPFTFGDGMRTNSQKGYVGEHIYSIRVYNKALTAQEVLANYNATVSYHKILVGGGAADNNNTGGGSLDDVE